MDDVLDKLRILAASDPKAARGLVESILDGDAVELEQLLHRLSVPDEGRLRQLVANTVRKRPDRENVVSHLLKWLEHESDEFARTAIQGALQGVDVTQRRHARIPEQSGLVETYRYVASRLCHKVRNALPGPVTHLRQIEDCARELGTSAGADILAVAGRLRESLRLISRLVEFDTSDGYFEWRAIRLLDWLVSLSREYNTRNEPITLELKHDPNHQEAIIRANAYLLETIFWNLWKNARQAVDGPCHITVETAVESPTVRLLMMDNGPGLPETMVGPAFEDQISTYGVGRGRGLLEVADAVQRLSGNVTLIRVEDRGYRVEISLPLGGA